MDIYILFSAVALFLLGGSLHWFANWRCRVWYRKEVAYWATFQKYIEAENWYRGIEWAQQDIQRMAQGKPVLGTPRGTPALTLEAYQLTMDGAAIPTQVELPQWITNRKTLVAQ